MNELNAVGVKSETVESQSKVRSGIAWVFFVVIIPLLVALIAIGGALQFVGVDVWGTTLHLIGVTKATSTPVKSPLSTAKQQLVIEKSKNTSLQSQIQSLQSQLSAEKTTEQNLSSKVNQLQGQLAVKLTEVSKAKKEAAYITSMDPTQAASVLIKMTTADAGAIIAEMNPTDASGVLGAMSATDAGRIMSTAAQISAALNSSLSSSH